MLKFFGVALALLLIAAPAKADPPIRYAPLGYCQITTLSAATLITPANCVRASFTATGSGSNLTTSSVTGRIQLGDALTGTGVPAGTYIVSQTSGVPNGAGVYVTSNATTSSAASLTSGGVPQLGTRILVTAETQAIRYRDDGAAPTAAVGMPVAVAVSLEYTGALGNIQFIEQTASAKINVLFYK